MLIEKTPAIAWDIVNYSLDLGTTFKAFQR